jgi:hypothetical protein
MPEKAAFFHFYSAFCFIPREISGLTVPLWPSIYGCLQFTNVLRICRPAMADLKMNKEC